MNNNPQNASQNPHNDEIDLFELISTLWKGKWTIIATTLICTVIAALVALFLIKPTYESSATIATPYVYEIDALNAGVILFQADPKLSTIDPSSVFNTLISTMTRQDFQRRYFKEFYLPRYQDGKTPLENSQANFSAFQKTLSISDNKESGGKNIHITAESAEESYTILNEFLTFANQVAKETILQNKKADIDLLMNNIQNSMKGIRTEMDTHLNTSLKELNVAYEIAKKINLETPMEQPTELFQQGTLALESKIALVKSRIGEYAHNARYSTLAIMLDSYKNIVLPKADAFATYQFTNSPDVPEKPIKPNKKLIVIIGFLLGGMLGCSIILLRQAIRNRKNTIA